MPATATRNANNAAKAVVEDAQVSNGGAPNIEASRPYIVRCRVEGTATFLSHAWNCEDVETKGAAAKGSKAKKTDNVESYVKRCANGEIGIPGTYLWSALCGKNGAAKFRQDPRSARKSALDLYRAGIVMLTEIATLGVKNWDFLDKRREVVQQAGITRTRPAFLAGWTCEFEIQCLLPEYISPSALHECLVDAGRLCGFGDHRPTYGRFNITRFDVIG